jgi:two-component system CheB/CheR fusion protein
MRAAADARMARVRVVRRHMTEFTNPKKAEPEPATPGLVVGIGASAGGLAACKSFFGNMPLGSGIAFVVVFHLDPSHESHLAGILQACTAMKVTQVVQQMRVEPGQVYVIAPDAEMHIEHGVLVSSSPSAPHGARMPIDMFFSSLAADQQERAVAIVLSGTGSDGSRGMQAVKAAGGMCIAQDPATAEYDSMPRNAIASNAVDHVVHPAEMPAVLGKYARHPNVFAPAGGEAHDDADGFEELLGFLEHRQGLDFHAYKRGTLRRRTERRMRMRQIQRWSDYLVYLSGHPAEISALYDDLLIGVTHFFRDPSMWDYLEKQVVPRLLDELEGRANVRIWVPGCATGEEAYSLAILFLEQLRERPHPARLQIFATDLDEEALAFARKGIYPDSIKADVSPERQREFFRPCGDNLQIAQSVREWVTFSKHDILTDPPFSRQDLVSCRNLLIYLEPHVQARVLEILHFALRPGGVMVLGNAETVGRQTDLFETLSNRWRIYRATGAARTGKHVMPLWGASKAEEPASEGGLGAAANTAQLGRSIQQLVLNRYASACVIVDRRFDIAYFFGPTHDYLTRPTGEARLDLLSWVRPGLYPHLRSALQAALEKKARVAATGIRMERGDVDLRVEMTVEPITSIPQADGLLLVNFRDAAESPTRVAEAGEPEQPLMHQLEEELKRNQQELQSSIEQLDRTTEEYRAREEELLSLNEELQSSNEELETSKEELQSLNEEVNTINRELLDKNTELQSLYADLTNLLINTDVPTVFLDRDMHVRRFTPAATRLMHLVLSDVGRAIDHIKQRTGDSSLIRDARAVLDSGTPLATEVCADDGRWYVRRVHPYRTEADRIDGVCITFNDITEQKQVAADLEEARLYAETILDTIRTPFVVLGENLHIVSANQCFYDTFQVSRDETENQVIYDLGNRQWDIPPLRKLLEELLPGKPAITGFEVEHNFEHLGHRIMLLNAQLMLRPQHSPLILLAFEDVSGRRQAEAAASERARALELEHRRKDEFLATLGHELRNPLSALLRGLELLRQQQDDPAGFEQLREMMHRQSMHMSGILDELLEVSRVISGKITLTMEPLELRDIARAAVESVHPLIEARRHELSVSLPTTPVAVLGDALRLTQVLANLLANAAKYTEEGGHIWLAVDADESAVRVTVRDTGIGMEPELLPHVFELFVQGRRGIAHARGGLGLGLPLVRSLVELHSGHIECSSPGVGQGSTFMVTLPRTRAARVPPAAKASPVGMAEGPARRILVVDDEVDFAKVLAETLQMQGHDAVAVYSAQAALEKIPSFRPDVVLLDLALPIMDGYEVAQRLRKEHGKQLSLIALSGYPRDGEHLNEAGFDDHLMKPLSMKMLAACLAALP